MLPTSSFAPALSLLLVGACNAEPATVSAPAGDFDAARAWRDLEAMVGFGARPPGSKELERTRVLIETELEAAGLEPRREPFTADTPEGDIEMCNVVADLEGRARNGEPAGIVILCSHFDTKRFDFEFVGANDGGSSTAVLLELARSLAAGGPRDLTYRFLFVDGEEALRPEWAGLDNTYGSRHHAQELAKTDTLERVRAAVVIDLVGDEDLQLTTDSYSDPELLRIFFKAARAIGLGEHVGGPQQVVKDDHLSFMRVGIPSVDLIDLEFGPDNAWWHSAEDTLAHCSQESLEAIGRIVLAALPAIEARFRDGR